MAQSRFRYKERLIELNLAATGFKAIWNGPDAARIVQTGKFQTADQKKRQAAVIAGLDKLIERVDYLKADQNNLTQLMDAVKREVGA